MSNWAARALVTSSSRAELQLDQGLADPLVVLRGVLEGVLQGLGADDLPVDQDLADFLFLSGHVLAASTNQVRI